MHPVRYNPDPEQLAARIDKRNKALGTEIILYCLHVRETGPEKLNCLAQRCIRIIWQDWEANGEHQYPLQGSARPFSSTNSLFGFFKPAGFSGTRQPWTPVSLHYITTPFKHSTKQELLVSEVFGGPVSCPPHLCSVLTHHVSSAKTQGLKSTNPWAPTFLLTAFTWLKSSHTFFLKPGSQALPPLCTFGNQLSRENFVDLAARGANVSCKYCSGVFKRYRPKPKTFALAFLPLLSLSLGSFKVSGKMVAFI